MAQKPSIPKGTRDFLPFEVAQRTYIFDTIKKSFQHYGFQPIETPSFELSSTLLGKYGEEGDRLIFRILKSGDFMTKIDQLQRFGQFGKTYSEMYDSIQDPNISITDVLDILKSFAKNSHDYIKETAEELMNSKNIASNISEKALRYDLTVPFARFVVQHQNDISFPFKRFQIQPVWRADRPQHGRYQEFFQCDADVVGSDSLLYEVDFIQLFDEVLTNLGLPSFTIKLNNRKILSGIAEVSGESDKLIAITVAIDKLDKIGIEGVVKELTEKGVSAQAIERITPLFSITGSTAERLLQMKAFLANSEIGLKGIEELEYVLQQSEALGMQRGDIEFDVTLARGLNYYTGAIFEVKANNVNMGSICGGGRYDDLTGLFGMSDMSGVGISFGADRIYDVMNELKLFPPTLTKGVTLLFINFGDKEQAYCMKLAHQLRKHGINCDIYPKAAKVQKQMKYANDTAAEFVALIGEQEIANQVISLKHMVTGEQANYSLEQLIEKLK